MEHTKLYHKEDISDALGISTRMVNHWLHKMDNHDLLKLYQSQRVFSQSQYEYIIRSIHGHLGLKDSGSGGKK